MDNRERIVEELVAFETAHLAAAERRLAEMEEERRKLSDLLLRARDAGLTNHEIAATLNGAEDGEDASRAEEPVLAMPGRYSTQLIAKRIGDAEDEASHAVNRLIRGDSPDDG